MGFLDSIVSTAFRDEQVGRVVVFPSDRRNRGYLVRSESDELKIKSFLKMFYLAYFCIFILGIMLADASSTFFVSLAGIERPAANLLRNFAISFSTCCLIVGVPYFLLWRSYRKALLSFVSQQDEVVAVKRSAMPQRWLLVVFGVAFLCLGLGIALLTRPR
jgi:hypothetical protein